MNDKILEFKERFEEDEKFREIFEAASNLDEIVDLAKENVYDIEIDDILSSVELSDQLLEAVAGGEDDTYIHKLIGNNNVEFTASNPSDAQKYAKMMVDELHKRGIYGK